MDNNKPSRIVDQMMAKDEFSQWLGIKVGKVSPGYCELSMVIRKEMLNGFGIAHGGICYSLADSALAFASNSHGRHSVSFETNINHLLPLKENDQIVAKVEEVSISHKLGIYLINILRNDDKIAIFKGSVYRKETQWD